MVINLKIKIRLYSLDLFQFFFPIEGEEGEYIIVTQVIQYLAMEYRVLSKKQY